MAAGTTLAGAALFAFPASLLGQIVSFPGDVPPLYRAFTAMFVLLFAGAYAFLARQERIDRAFVAFGAIGKTLAFLVAGGLWLADEIATSAVLLFGLDLALAAVFVTCLAGMRGR